eukprot:EG_transcript_15779
MSRNCNSSPLGVLCVLALLFVHRVGPASSASWCMQSPEDISVERPGRWVNGSYAHPGHFARSPDPAEWFATACPVQQRVFSCYRHASGGERPWAVEHRLFVPDGCALHAFHPEAFLRAIANRRVLFCCDSAAQQFFEAVVCSLHNVTPAAYQIDWSPVQHRFGTEACPLPTNQHCHLNSATVSYPAFNASLSVLGTHLHKLNRKWHGYNLPQEYFAAGRLQTPRDVLVLNFGLHFGNNRGFDGLLKGFLSAYSTIAPTSRPFLLWSECIPQHFNTVKFANGSNLSVGQWVPDIPQDQQACTPYPDVAEARRADYKNRVAERLCAAHRVAVLRTAEASRWAWDAHIGLRFFDGRNATDCTHFCQPSAVFLHWRELLYNALLVA